MDLDAFDFHLPEDRIALRPVEPQDAARMLVVHGDGTLEDAMVRDLPRYLSSGDHLVFNDTRVLPAALKGVRPARDADGRDVAVDMNLVGELGDRRWLALARPGRRLKAGDVIGFGGALSATLVARRDGGEVEVEFDLGGADLREVLGDIGAMPLPPYIARRRAADARDRDTYQTRFASEDAQSVAAPTAGLHFTQRLLDEIDAAGLVRETVRLHVGLGTFAPLDEDALKDNRLHEEWRRLTPDTAVRLNAARAKGNRCVPVGTTALRTLESCVDADGALHPATGPTDIFLKPGDPLRATDALITNFHLPRSSLFMLVCALMGTEVMQAAYAHAIASGYRFYSYGDACLLLPGR
ncbi:MAG: tRNA preQ1(34) S-adenosylmethionine ribosyltransferase-isomerase QueA [Pseudomonadota bacterium]